MTLLSPRRLRNVKAMISSEHTMNVISKWKIQFLTSMLKINMRRKTELVQSHSHSQNETIV